MTTAAAAPSPNKAVATIAAGSSLSSRIEIEQVSTVTNSQLLPGSAAARRAAVARPLTPPAQPRPKIGTRRTSSRRPMRGPTRASRLGVAMPVVETVTTPSISIRRRGRPARSPRRRPPRTALGSIEIDARCVRVQPWWLLIPIGRSDDVAPGDAGIVEHARQPVEKRLAPAERLARQGLGLVLLDGSLGHRPWRGKGGFAGLSHFRDCLNVFLYTLTHELKRSALCGYRTGPPGAKSGPVRPPALDRNGAGSRHLRMWPLADVRFTCATGGPLKGVAEPENQPGATVVMIAVIIAAGSAAGEKGVKGEPTRLP